MFIKPKPGLRVRDPHSKLHLPATGAEVPDADTFWTRRLQDGDVVLAAPKAAPEIETAQDKE